MRFTVPYDELEIKATKGGGPGGQHVNKASTRIEVRWNVAASQALSDDQRVLLNARLGHRLDGRGIIRVVCAAHRSQQRNKHTAIARLNHLVTRALKPVKPRKTITPSRAQRDKRLQDKRRRAERKRQRRKPDIEE